MNNLTINIFLYISFSLTLFGCQNQYIIDKNNIDTKNTTKIATAASPAASPVAYQTVPCKNFSSPLIKDKSKIKAMLLKEGKLTSEMSEEETSRYMNKYIKNKSTRSCKPTLKKMPKIENTHHA